jgi:hypothetical protein
MSSRSATKGIAAAALLGAVLGGCSEYLDRRDTVSLHSGEAMAANRVTMMIDPWPAASGRRNIAYNGERAAKASERYRTGKVIPPVNPTTSSAAYQGSQPDSGANNTPAASTPPGTTSPVK